MRYAVTLKTYAGDINGHYGKWPLGVSVMLSNLNLSVRAENALRLNQINSVDQLLDIICPNPEHLGAYRNIGDKTLDEIIGALRSKGYIE